MLAANMQCWRMVRALRSPDIRWLVVSSDEMSPYTSRSRTSSVTDRRLILTCQPRRTTRKIFASSVERIHAPWSRWQQNWLDLSNGQVRRQSLQSVHDITGSFTSCYKSHRLQTRLFLFIPCGILSWLPVSFLLHIKYTLSYRIVQNIVLSTRLLVVVQSSSITK